MNLDIQTPREAISPLFSFFRLITSGIEMSRFIEVVPLVFKLP